MPNSLVNLTEQNNVKLDLLSRATGKSRDALVNEAIDQFADSDAASEVLDWKAALMRGAGIWEDRDDIPDLMAQLRREWSRVEPPENP